MFADGACSGNPGPGGWGVVIATPDGRVLELGGGQNPATNNQMELLATIRGLDRIRSIPGEVDVCTDSVYVIKGITQWIWNWRRNGWKSKEGGEVANQDLWNALSRILVERKEKFGKNGAIHWRYVRGHTGVPGNERVDEIAVSFTKGTRTRLFEGTLLDYGIAIHDLPDSLELPDRPAKPREEKKTAHSYLSLVGGTAMRHRTWAECEARVKGTSGAKFKKAMSAAEEAEILKSWGLSPAALA